MSSTQKLGIPTIIATALVLLTSVLMLPGLYVSCRNAGVSAAFGMFEKQGVPHDQAVSQAVEQGPKLAILGLLSSHIPIIIYSLIAIGIISKTTKRETKRRLLILFFVTTALGAYFASLYVASGNSNGSPVPFRDALGITGTLYGVYSVVFWVIVGVGVLLRGKPRDSLNSPPPRGSTSQPVSGQRNAQQQGHRDTPLMTFDVKDNRSLYRLTVRNHTLLFLNLRTDEEILFDPNSDEFGLELKESAFSSDRITLIDRRGSRRTFYARAPAVPKLKKWWRARMPV